MTLAPHQQRVVDELADLQQRLDKLVAFSEGPVFASLPELDQLYLDDQADIMEQYAAILKLRIGRFQ